MSEKKSTRRKQVYPKGETRDSRFAPGRMMDDLLESKRSYAGECAAAHRAVLQPYDPLLGPLSELQSALESQDLTQAVELWRAHRRQFEEASTSVPGEISDREATYYVWYAAMTQLRLQVEDGRRDAFQRLNLEVVRRDLLCEWRRMNEIMEQARFPLPTWVARASIILCGVLCTSLGIYAALNPPSRFESILARGSFVLISLAGCYLGWLGAFGTPEKVNRLLLRALGGSDER